MRRGDAVVRAKGDGRAVVTLQALWAVPFGLAVGLGAIAVQQAWVGDEAAWYLVWPVVALVVAAGCLAAAGPYRRLLLLGAPGFAVWMVKDDISGWPRWALMTISITSMVLVIGEVSRYRLPG